MLKIAFLAGKGGVTKSTLARAIAARLAAQGKDVIGLDMDSDQRTFYRWSLRRATYDVEPQITVVPDVSMHKIGRYLAGTQDVAVIDGSAYASKETVEIVKLADFIVLPSAYSVDDLESVVRIYNQLTRRGIDSSKIAIVLSGVTESESEFRECKTGLEELGAYVLPHAIPRKTSYSKAQDKGLSICEVKNQPRLFTLARYAIDALIERAYTCKEE